MSENGETIVVVGAGHAAGQLCASLRSGGFEGEILLIGEEGYLPYQRPPLSKTYLAGELTEDRLLFRPEDFYGKNRISTRLGTRAVSIDRAERSLQLDDGDTVTYTGLALTTGARVRRLPLPGTDLAGVHYLRNIADVNRIRSGLDAVRDIVVIGGGFIGLEVAAVCSKMGKNVTVLEMQDRLMPRVVSPTVSAFYRQAHERHGVRIVTAAQVSKLAGASGKLAGVHCAGGGEYAAQMAIVGIGVIPNTELAEAAGLQCDNGIVVDESARTTDAAIVAAGDCTYHPNALIGARLRLESVQNALDQAKTAAASLIGKQRPYRQIPWFWSDQYDLKLQMVGISAGYDREVVRGELSASQFSVFYFKDSRLIAVDSVNRPADHMLSRKLLGEGKGPTPEQTADTSFDLKALL